MSLSPFVLGTILYDYITKRCQGTRHSFKNILHLSLSLFLTLSPSFSLSLSLYLSLSLPPSLSLSPSLPLSPSLSLSLPPSLSLSVTLSLSLWPVRVCLEIQHVRTLSVPHSVRMRDYIYNNAGSVISNGREPKSCLGRVFNYKLGHIAILCGKCMAWYEATSRVENSAQGLSCLLSLSMDNDLDHLLIFASTQASLLYFQ